ncbi:MAG: diphosphomevalonate decarboxylase [Deltaproteobacteria bacterium]|nr:diphosphomevalonate decarboxylase [Deltaproteobacteria bacterium]MBN2674038.1 diphosphomevalonate decarboxylase [Deltaproteobacteria bacterium]
MEQQVTAVAHANVALVKYFGKRDVRLNLPAAPSLSLTLKPLQTTTKLMFSNDKADVVIANGVAADEKFAGRICSFLHLFRQQSGNSQFLTVHTENNFPTAAGLASSAAGFAALTVGAARLFGLSLSESELSAWARRGSGSASRSVCGGIVHWQRGGSADGSDSFARSILPAGEWDLRILVGVTTRAPKEIGSTSAMEHTRTTSPYYRAWIDSATAAVDEAIEAVSKKDFERLGEVTEHSALSMHASLMAAQPPIVFLKGATIDVFHLTRTLRKEGIQAYFTCDAGPQPKILCQGKDANAVEARLRACSGVVDVIHCSLGEGAGLQTPE